MQFKMDLSERNHDFVKTQTSLRIYVGSLDPYTEKWLRMDRRSNEWTVM